jgi:hypothetical protein
MLQSVRKWHKKGTNKGHSSAKCSAPSELCLTEDIQLLQFHAVGLFVQKLHTVLMTFASSKFLIIILHDCSSSIDRNINRRAPL